MTVDGKTYKYHGVYPASTKFNNVTSETGKVVEGITTVVYQYELAKPSWEVPSDAPILEVPEYEGGVSPVEPPVLEVPEYKGGVSPIEPPVLEVPEYEGGVSSAEPPVLEVPEYEGGVVPLDPPIVDKPELKIPEEPAPTPQPEPTPKAPEKAVEPVKPVVIAQVKRLANTGSETSNAAVLGFGALIAGIALAVRKRQKEK